VGAVGCGELGGRGLSRVRGAVGGEWGVNTKGGEKGGRGGEGGFRGLVHGGCRLKTDTRKNRAPLRLWQCRPKARRVKARRSAVSSEQLHSTGSITEGSRRKGDLTDGASRTMLKRVYTCAGSSNWDRDTERPERNSGRWRADLEGIRNEQQLPEEEKYEPKARGQVIECQSGKLGGGLEESGGQKGRNRECETKN